MNKKLILTATVVMLLISGTTVLAQSKMITPKKLSALIATGMDLNIIDLRTDSEVSSGKIKGAMQVNYYADDFEDKLKALDKAQTYYVYCKSGGRSGKAAAYMAELGFETIYDLKGGITRWTAEGNSIKREEP